MSVLAMNGVGPRDTTAARLAQLDPEGTAKRRAEALAMAADGKPRSEIQAALKAKYGMGVSPTVFGKPKRKNYGHATDDALKVARQMAAAGKKTSTIRRRLRREFGCGISNQAISNMRHETKAPTRAPLRKQRPAEAPPAPKADTVDALTVAMRIVELVRPHPKEMASRAIRAALAYLE